MFNFAKECGLTPEQVHTIYQDNAEKCIYIKFMKEERYKEFLNNNKESTFKYTNGAETSVNIIPANNKTKYVWIFNLPTDVTDAEIAEKLKEYGQITGTKREKYAASTCWRVFSGVRGVFIDLMKEIPQSLTVVDFKCRVYHEGQKERCFKCGSENHIKSNCDFTQKRIYPSTINDRTLYSSVIADSSQSFTQLSQKNVSESMKTTPYDEMINIKEVMQDREQKEQKILYSKSDTDINNMNPNKKHKEEKHLLATKLKISTKSSNPLEHLSKEKLKLLQVIPSNVSNSIFGNEGLSTTSSTHVSEEMSTE